MLDIYRVQKLWERNFELTTVDGRVWTKTMWDHKIQGWDEVFVFEADPMDKKSLQATLKNDKKVTEIIIMDQVVSYKEVSKTLEAIVYHHKKKIKFLWMETTEDTFDIISPEDIPDFNPTMTYTTLDWNDLIGNALKQQKDNKNV